MDFQISTIGSALSGPSGIVELMADLGAALAGGGSAMRMLGGGNPAHIPEMQAVWRHRLHEIVADEPLCDRMLANYDGPAGNPRFLEAVAQCLSLEYGWPVTPDHLAVTCGGQSAFFYLFTLLAGETPGGGKRRILLPIVPEYIGYADQGLAPATFKSFHPRIDLLPERRFKYRIDFDALAMGDDVGAVCVSRPTNPTGNVLTDGEVARLADMAEAAGVPLLVDNAYGEPFPGAVYEPIRPIWRPGMVLTFSLSKLGLPGTRTGIVLADPDLIRRVRSLTGIVGLANGNLGQTLVEPLLREGRLLELCRNHIRPYYEAKSIAAQQMVEANFGDAFPWRIHRSEGAFFLWLWFPELPIASRELYERLKRRGVLVVPGEYFFFGLPGGDDWPHRRQCIRLTFSQPEAVVREGIEIIADELRAVHGVAR